MNKFHLIFLCCLIASNSLHAEDSQTDDMLLLLNNDLDKYSQIATATRQNVDYMPYVISVLEVEELSQLGLLTLRDALNLVPGVDLSIGMAGIKNPVFRGSNPYAVGQSKLIIDGVVVNDTLFGAYVQYLDMPVDLIQRIEVVRGPGSLLSHVNGYSGSIHVVTKANRDDGLKTDNEYFVTVGSDELGRAGFVTAFEENDIEFSIDGYYQQHDQSVESGVDRFGNQGEIDQAIKNLQLGVNVRKGNLQLRSRLSENNSGVSYGQAFSVTDDDKDFLDVANNFLEISYLQKLTSGSSLKYFFDYFDETRKLQNKVMPDGSMIMMPPPGMTLPNGRYFIVDYREQSVSGRIELEINIDSLHDIKAGVKLSKTVTDNNNAAMSGDNLTTFNRFDLLTAPDREHYTIYIEDLINFNERFSLQLGLKIDGFHDADDQLSPRLAMVYRHDSENIYKFMYTRSFREPSWREQYLTQPAFFSSTNLLEVETVDAYEASYIKRKGDDDYYKFNIFYLENSDQIHAQNPTRTFLNSGDNELYGAEFEYKVSIANYDKLYFNYSYVDGENVFDELASSAQNMAKFYYIHNLSEDMSVSGIVKHVGQKQRVIGDVRSSTSSYNVLDLALNYRYDEAGLALTLGVTNAFDDTYVMPSPVNTYVDDFEQPAVGYYLRLKGNF